MSWQLSTYAVAVLLASVLAGTVALFAAQNRDIPGGEPLTVLMGLVSVWCLASAVSILRTDLATKASLVRINITTSTLIPVVWLWFTLEYTAREEWMTRSRLTGLSIVPLVTVAVIWLNPAGIFWRETSVVSVGATRLFNAVQGPWLALHLSYSYLLLAAGTLLLVQMLVLSSDLYRGQTALLIASVGLPLGANAAFHAGIVPLNINPTPVALSGSGILMSAAIYRYRLLEVVPLAREVARDETFEQMVEGVLICNERGTIVDANPVASAMFDSELVGTDLSAVSADLAAAISNDLSSLPDQLSLTRTCEGQVTHYDVRIAPIRRGAGILTGYLMTLRDVTAERRRKQRLTVLNRTLRHDLRNDANVILARAEMLDERLDGSDASAISRKVRELVEMGEKMRQLEQLIDAEGTATTATDAVELLRDCIDRFRNSYPDAKVTVDLPDSAWVSTVDLLTLAVDDLLENAVVHNDAETPRISLSATISGDTVVIRVADNGPGIPQSERAVLERGYETQLDHASGIGLWLVNWIVTESDGEVRFRKNEPRGSVVELHLPRTQQPASAAANHVGATTSLSSDD